MPMTVFILFMLLFFLLFQKEISNLKQIIETQKQNLNGKMKKSALEFKQQM